MPRTKRSKPDQVRRPEDVLKRTADLVPWPNNPRHHDEGQIARIRSSLREYGFTNPIIINDEGMILAGHGRWMAAQAEGIDEVPCVMLHGLTKAQQRAYVIADNQIALTATWDYDALGAELAQLVEAQEIDPTLTGFDQAEIDALIQALEGDQPPDLDALEDQHGEHDDRTMWPKIQISVDPDTFEEYQSRMAAAYGSDEAAKFRSLVMSADWEALRSLPAPEGKGEA
jgi:hypothetical protein